MTGADFRATLGRLGISQAALKRLLVVDKQTVNRWAQGTSPIPQCAVLLLLLLESGKVKIADLEKLAAQHSQTHSSDTQPSR